MAWGELQFSSEHGRRILAEVTGRLERRCAQIRDGGGWGCRRIHHQILGRDGARRGTCHRVGDRCQPRSGELLRGEHGGLKFVCQGVRWEIKEIVHVFEGKVSELDPQTLVSK